MNGNTLARVPRPHDIDAAWLTDILAGQGHDWDIAGFTMESVGTGQLGDTLRLTLRYGARQGPETIVGKFAAESQDSRDAAAANNLYAREVGFYRDLAGRARISTAACYGAALADDGSFVLLLEDCAPARTGDQIAGITAAQANASMVEAARLHAAFWDRGDAPELAWLDTGEQGAPPLSQPFYPAEALRGAWPEFRDRHADNLTAEMIRVCDRFCERYEGYNAAPSRPRCVTHNDYRPDNMLFLGDESLKVVDWQSAALGFNAVDVSYLIGGAFAPGVRRDAEAGLLGAYHDELLRQGVTGYARADFEEDYRRFTFAGINVAVCAAMSVQRTERGDRLFLTMLDRHVSHVVDTGALAILDAG
ncbi:ecdysteroid 22-kinase family protein [Novosphingobium sp. KCTC 2891]|uniref:ecdysteroid 22-kinase family protein n=1 Tax=Novosphingobium sp. KCTC 2891 TaxID=2989730 RepID=UPI0022234CF6|nr:ecdysteroid 22-kinase family protein [Novosphingobium sp. KCTC 2891]MCW1382100.1 ecdysteroid 22-kinase family protein [Novosphingobium sp. KCTC 2891]